MAFRPPAHRTVAALQGAATALAVAAKAAKSQLI